MVTMEHTTMRVIAYTYAADVHCPHCAKLAYASGALRLEPGAAFSEDEHGIPYTVTDSEGNMPGAIFSYSIEQEEYCGDCHEIIPETEGLGRPE